MKYFVCRCRAFPWPHAYRLAQECMHRNPIREWHDSRDRGDPLEKIHPDPRHWSNWDRRTDLDGGTR